MNYRKYFNFAKFNADKEFTFSFSVRTSAVDRKSNKPAIGDCCSKILDLPGAKKILTHSSRGTMTGAAGEKRVLRSNECVWFIKVQILQWLYRALFK